MLPSNLAASGLPINGSKACLDFCEGLSGEVRAELSLTSLSSPLWPRVVARHWKRYCELPRNCRSVGKSTVLLDSRHQRTWDSIGHLHRGARHAVLRTLYSRAHRIGLDGASWLLCALTEDAHTSSAPNFSNSSGIFTASVACFHSLDGPSPSFSTYSFQNQPAWAAVNPARLLNCTDNAVSTTGGASNLMV
jgi:hypothetical protein